MKIVYNPSDGAPITGFIYQGELKEPHYPAGYETPKGEIASGLMQYNDFEADDILETFEFLQLLNIEQAKAILNKPAEPKFKCDYPGCEFASVAKIGLEGHKRKHAKDIQAAKTPVVEEELIPVAKGKKIPTLAEMKKMSDNGEEDLSVGTDHEGVEWYGEGVTIENRNSFGNIKEKGKGHFIG